jgi:cytochrome P450
MSGGVWFMYQFPAELQKLKDNPALVESAVSEIIRYQTPPVLYAPHRDAGYRDRWPADQER